MKIELKKFIPLVIVKDKPPLTSLIEITTSSEGVKTKSANTKEEKRAMPVECEK